MAEVPLVDWLKVRAEAAIKCGWRLVEVRTIVKTTICRPGWVDPGIHNTVGEDEVPHLQLIATISPIMNSINDGKAVT